MGRHSWFERLSNMLIREPRDREQLMNVLRDAEERQILSEEMLTMIESVLQVSEMQVRDVMIPKVHMTAVNCESSLEELLPVVIESSHSRFPVIDPEDNDVVGILLAKDLLKYVYHKELKQFNVRDILRPAVFVPQSKRLDTLLNEFRVNRNHMAIVIDEYGHLAGLVTIEDVLEQIVGEIEDEYDADKSDQIRQHTDGSYVVKAITSIEDFNNFFHTNFSDEESNTIGGVILKTLGHLPRRGEILKMNDYQFKILHSDNRRIYLLEVMKI